MFESYREYTKLKIIAFSPAFQQEARRLILDGLGEHWGWVDEHINVDLENIESSYISGHFVVGMHKEKLVATGAVIPEQGDSWRIVRMSVDKQYRRYGFGHMILEHLINIAEQASIKKVVLEATASWSYVIEFYKSYGFRVDESFGGDTHMSLKPD